MSPAQSSMSSQPVDQRGPHRSRAAAQIDDDRMRPGQRHGLVDQELGAAPRHEDARLDDDAQATELGPAQDLFQRVAGDPLAYQSFEFGGRRRGGDQQRRLVLGEHTAGRSEPGRQRCGVRVRQRRTPRSTKPTLRGASGGAGADQQPRPGGP